MVEFAKPSTVLYSDLKSFGRIAHKRAAEIMLTPKGYASLDDSRISRDVVNADPGSPIMYQYRNFKEIAEQLTRELIVNRGGNEKGRQAVLTHYGSTSSRAVTRMCQALSNYGMRPGAYINLLDRIALNELASDRQKCLFSVMLFCACGALGNPDDAAHLTDLAFEELHATSIGTVAAPEGVTTRSLYGTQGGVDRLGLLRVVHGMATTPLYELALPPEQTIIGSRDCAIMDVAPDVSRKHLAIWNDGNRWVCQGLNSLNGTALISGASGSITTVELPRAQRGGQASPVVPIAPGDTLCLGAQTRFLVTSLTVR